MPQEPNDYVYWNAQAKERQQNANERRTKWMNEACEKLGLTAVLFAPNSYRLSKGDLELNYYPTSGKIFQHKLNKFLAQPDNPTKFLTKYFTKNQADE